MGGWIMVPRTRFGDDLLRTYYDRGVRQLVLLGAGFDARAFRLSGMGELKCFEVDQKTTFDVKEPLLASDPLAVASRHVVATEFTNKAVGWGAALEAAGFISTVPTVWLLEGLLMYLSLPDTRTLMEEIGRLSATGSLVFHDAVSATYVVGGRGPVVGGAKFIGGSDDYASLWREHAGFGKAYVRNFESITVDRGFQRLSIDERYPEATPKNCRGRNVVLFVTAEK
jgi:methyltransferase (TIGR00027 family)